MSAQQQLSKSQSIVIVAREFPNRTSINYATPWAGAHYRPVPGTSGQILQEYSWAKRSYEVFKQIVAEEPLACGVSFVPGEEYLQNPTQEYIDAVNDVSSGVYGHMSDSFERLDQTELGDAGFRLGIRYKSFCVNSPVYAAYLLRKFVHLGGETLEYTLAAAQEAFSLRTNVTTVVNCSGMGFGDPQSFIIRGGQPLKQLTRPFF